MSIRLWNIRKFRFLSKKFKEIVSVSLVFILLMPFLNENSEIEIDATDFFNSEFDNLSENNMGMSNNANEAALPLAIINIDPGDITGNNMWTPNTYIINGNISILGNLTILPKVNIKINGNYTIMVNGTLIIRGQKSDDVKITPNINSPTPGFWGGILFNNQGNGSIEFAKISYARNGVYFNQALNSTVVSTRIEYSSESGITCYKADNITLMNNSFSRNLIVGLKLDMTNNSMIKYNTLNSNRNGIALYNSNVNRIISNSLSNEIINAYDDNLNQWEYNYYGNYSGNDTDTDNIGDTNLPYLIAGGLNNDSYPRTKIFIRDSLLGYASISTAIENSINNSHIFIRAETPEAGSQTIDQDGYFYENIKIDSNTSPGIHIYGPGPEGFKNTSIDGNLKTCIDVDNGINFSIIGVSIINSETGILIRNCNSKTIIQNIRIKDNIHGIMVDDSSNVIIENSTIRNNNAPESLGGMVISKCNSVTIYNNTFNNNRRGLVLLNSYLNTIDSNFCTANIETGIWFNKSYSNTVINNEIVSNLVTGLNLSFGSHYNEFNNNSFQTNKYGINLYRSKHNYFTQSIIFANTHRGISFENKSNNNTFFGLAKEQFSGSPTAIECNKSVENRFVNGTVDNMNIWLDKNSAMIFLNMEYTKPAVAIWDSLSSLKVMNYLTVRVINQSATPLSNVTVEIFDNKSRLIFSDNTDENGEVPLVELISHIHYKNRIDYSSNFHEIVVNDSISEKVAYINITEKILKVFKFNYIPSIVTKPLKTIFEKKYYSVEYSVLNKEKDKNLTWRFSTNTSDWLKFGENNQTLYGTPHNRDVGRVFVNISVMDVDGDTEYQYFELEIKNTLPEFLTENIVTVNEDELYFNDYNSTDDDGYYNETGVFIEPQKRFITWSIITTASDWLNFDYEYGILNGTPTNNHVGFYGVHIFVYDGHGGMNTANFNLTVENVPPDITTPNKKNGYKNLEYYNDYNCSDDGQGEMTWELETNADWLYIDKSNGILNGTPGQDDLGDWWVEISVIDNHGGRTSSNFTLNVIDLNEPPIIDTENIGEAYVEKEYYVQYNATDEDTPLDLLFWEISENLTKSNATWLTMDPKTGVLRGTPLERHIGWYWVTVIVFDNAGGFDSTTFRLDVLPSKNRPPDMKTIIKSEIIKKSNERWTKQFKATDDKTSIDDLYWTLRSDATWLIINSSTGIIDFQFNQTHEGRYWVNVTVMDEGGLFNFTNFTFVVESSNNAPRLSNAGIIPKSGDDQTLFTFYVTYTDKDNEAGKVWVIIDNVSNLMTPDERPGSKYSEGVNYTTKIKLSKGIHEYYFTAKDVWDFDAKYGKGVPRKNNPTLTTEIKEKEEEPNYFEQFSWVVILVIIIILLILFLMFIKPEQFNPVIRARVRHELEVTGELGYLCPVCRSVVSKDAQECGNCGERFLVREYLCPNCQAVVSDKALFCSKCGSRFETVEYGYGDELELVEEPIEGPTVVEEIKEEEIFEEEPKEVTILEKELEEEEIEEEIPGAEKPEEKELSLEKEQELEKEFEELEAKGKEIEPEEREGLVKKIKETKEKEKEKLKPEKKKMEPGKIFGRRRLRSRRLKRKDMEKSTKEDAFKPIKPIKNVKPVKSVKSVKPIKSIKAAKPIKSVKPIKAKLDDLKKNAIEEKDKEQIEQKEGKKKNKDKSEDESK